MYVGIADLQNQIHRNAIRNGFQMNVLLLGEPSLGKSTFIETLFDSTLTLDSSPNINNEIAQSDEEVRLSTVSYNAVENEVKLQLTVTTIKNFGVALNNTDSWIKISSFLDEKFVEYIKYEHSLDRQPNFADPRIHCCFYFLNPSGTKIGLLDLKTMKSIHQKVNLIPIISKADSYTEKEMAAIKKNILDQLKNNKISVFPDILSEQSHIERYSQYMPFSVITACDSTEINGKRMSGRNYPWGFLDVLDTNVSDFRYLRDYFLKVTMYSLIESTNDIIYNRIRTAYLMGRNLLDEDLFDKNIDQQIYEQEKQKIDERIRKYKEELTAEYEKKLNAEIQELRALKQSASINEDLHPSSHLLDQENKSSLKDPPMESSSVYLKHQRSIPI